MLIWQKGAATFLAVASAVAAARGQEPEIKVKRFLSASGVDIVVNGSALTLQKEEQAGRWTLMAVVRGTDRNPVCAVLEDVSVQTGDILFVDQRGVRLSLPKSLEPTFNEPKEPYLGHTIEEIRQSPTDLLAKEILKGGDPNYEEIAQVFPPIRNMKTYTFVGTPDTFDKVGFTYGGRTPNFDPAPYFPAINQIRDAGKIWNGLVGGYLPVVRFVYPESEQNWTEMIAFAPWRMVDGNDRQQPVWYRVMRVEDGKLKWVKYIDSYHPFPPRLDYDPRIFYGELWQLKVRWDRVLQQSMRIEVPDARIANMARYSLIRAIMTRFGDYPKYGALDRDYGGSEHDGFPDTFTVETAAMLDWGLIDRAARYIDNYFGRFVRDDGSLLYRGPEIGQYGRMLTVVAQYANYGGDPAVLLKRRSRIDGVAKLLLSLRGKALALPKDDPAYGMIAGWSEADASLDPDPPRYMQPYFSNSSEAARGFQDLGTAWQDIGKKTSDEELIRWGKRLSAESAALRKDLQSAIHKSMLPDGGEKSLPAIAGAKELFHVAVVRDDTDPQFRSYRAYMEMMYSGILSDQEIRSIFAYRSRHYDVILGMPTAYGYKSGELAGFLSYGFGYGLIQTDMIREALLTMYADMAHGYTRGTWTAPETRDVLSERPVAPYCTPAQLVEPMLTRWLLVFEEPDTGTVWLAKAAPREWLEDGKAIQAEQAPTRWGRIGFSIHSSMDSGSITADVQYPERAFRGTTKVRLRAPGRARIRAVTVNGANWTQFDREEETITIPPGRSGKVKVVARY